jgi:hypothetical protein
VQFFLFFPFLGQFWPACIWIQNQKSKEIRSLYNYKVPNQRKKVQLEDALCFSKLDLTLESNKTPHQSCKDIFGLSGETSTVHVKRREEKGTIQKYRKCSKTEEDRAACF